MTEQTPAQQFPAGWYIHPTTQQRTWWDGTQWTGPAPKKTATVPVWLSLGLIAIALGIGIIIGQASA